jgi:hypothetical protein
MTILHFHNVHYITTLVYCSAPQFKNEEKAKKNINNKSIECYIKVLVLVLDQFTVNCS